jgi:hypothetical protein
VSIYGLLYRRVAVLIFNNSFTWLQEVFDSADVEGVGELDEYEVVRLMKKLNNSLATVKIQQKLKVVKTCYLSLDVWHLLMLNLCVFQLVLVIYAEYFNLPSTSAGAHIIYENLSCHVHVS